MPSVTRRHFLAGTALALGALPSPWTVLWFEVDGSVRTQTFQLPAGNAYRLITVIHFNTGRVYVRRVLTHAAYTRGTWQDD